MNEALTINGNGAQRNPDIHWSKGQHPEDADLYAHTEIMVNESCETVFAKYRRCAILAELVSQLSQCRRS
jgi:hypothetical protein